MNPNRDEVLERIYELTKENNKMLHSMRRGAFIGGIIKIIIWAALIIAPLWFYATYLAPTLNQAIGAMNQAQSSMQQLQDAGAQISVPAQDFSKIFEGLKTYLPNNGEAQ